MDMDMDMDMEVDMEDMAICTGMDMGKDIIMVDMEGMGIIMDITRSEVLNELNNSISKNST